MQQPGTHERRLAAAGRADDAQQRCADETGHELGDQVLAPEEVLGVPGVVEGEALVRAHDVAGTVGERAGGEILGGPQVDDAVRQLGLRGARLTAHAGCAPGGRVHPPQRGPAGELAGGLVHPAGYAARGSKLRLGGEVRPVTAGDRRDGLVVERSERDAVARSQTRQRGGLLPGDEGEHRRGRDGAREPVQRVAHLLARAIRVVDDEQRRLVGVARARSPPARAPARRHRPRK